jgi:hypothetical protein
MPDPEGKSEGKKQRCHYCGEPGDLRPYGPDGSWVCFPCTTATDERSDAAGAVFADQVLTAFNSGADLVVLDTDGNMYVYDLEDQKKMPGLKKRGTDT